MCGIIAALGHGPVQDLLLSGLKCMEYRGYDSAGICTLEDEAFACCKRKGKLANLTSALQEEPLQGHIGIGHTRWATHGGPSEINAHPHSSHDVAVVHNGIVENFTELKQALQSKGAEFVSETDSEVIPWLIETELREQGDMQSAFQTAMSRLKGAYAIAVMQRQENSVLWFARKGSPLLLARGTAGMFLASDALAVAGLADEVMYLQEGEWGHMNMQGVALYDADGHVVQREWTRLPFAAAATDKGPYAHYMLKEIHEQPRVISEIVAAYAGEELLTFPGAEFVESAPLPRRIVMVACGTSYHAALTARYWLERYLQIPVEVDVASEYRYRDPVIGPDTWLVTLSQSGETADTLEALRLFKQKTPENYALAICNVPNASLVRESDGLIELKAGPEIGVASTKAYTAQLTVLALFAWKLALRTGAMLFDEYRGHRQAMLDAVQGIEGLLERAGELDALTGLFAHVHGALFLGRGPCFPLALEGALKLKEISYLHAEGYAAGEMKHGPIALIDETLPVIVIAPRQYHLEKVISNLHEVQARGARVILLTDAPGAQRPEGVDAVIDLPEGDFFTSPLLAAVPLQLLAYNVARAKGTDVDQPRNLAKSVTVE